MAVNFVVVPPRFNLEEHNFFDFNPEHIGFDCISKLVKEVGYEVASKVMWAFYFSEDPASKFFLQPNKREIIERNLINNVGFDWGKYSYVEDCYPEISMSPAKRDYYLWRNVYDQFQLDVVEEKDLKIRASILSQLERIQKALTYAETKMLKELESADIAKGGKSKGKFA